MKLARRFDKFLAVLTVLILSVVFGAIAVTHVKNTFAGNEDGVYEAAAEHFVTFYDDGTKLTVKTNAKTVGEALERAHFELAATDIVEPAKTDEINSNNFFINIYRSRPAVVKDGTTEKYIMTASYDAKVIAKEAGIAIYDGDEIKMVPNGNFLEAGAASVYEISRNGGRTITEEVEIPFTEETVRDVNLDAGKKEVRQLGEVGLKKVYYEVFYENNKEVKREVTGEEVVRQAVPRVVAIGVKKSIPPEWSTCAEWAREAGVAEAELATALDIIYRESGCRYNSTNASSGAYGIPQALPGSKMASAGADWETNPVTQIRWMIGYVNGRYGGWAQALEFWYAHGWY